MQRVFTGKENEVRVPAQTLPTIANVQVNAELFKPVGAVRADEYVDAADARGVFERDKNSAVHRMAPCGAS
jgi:hypothetical protein